MKQTFTHKRAGGSIEAISSKSWLHRALICAALAEGKTELRCHGFGEDVLATADCLRALGATVEQTPDAFTVCGGISAKTATLFCRSSAATLRFLLPVATACGVSAEFVCSPQLKNRPITPLCEELSRHGVRIERTETGLRCEGRLQPGDYSIDGSISSQYLSGLLLALPILVDDSKIMLTDKPASASYISLTQSVQTLFGVDTINNNPAFRIPNSELSVPGRQTYRTPGSLTAEGDWSNAAPFLCAGAFSDSGVTVTGLSVNSVQGDRKMLDLLARFGAEVCVSDAAVTVRRGSLHGICTDASDVPDLVPLLALLGACAEGETTISNVARLRAKESDRLQTTADTLNALGACVTVTQGGLRISGTGQLHGGTVTSFGDHRIAMLAAVASLACTQSVLLDGSEAVSKSYPDFFNDFSKICR